MEKAKGLVVFTSGFGSGSVGGSSNPPGITGVGVLSEQSFINDLGYEKLVFSWDDNGIAEKINEFHSSNPDAKIILIGHSLGGDTSVEIAQELGEKNITIDKLILIDTVGINDDVKPDNVSEALNLWSTSQEGINAESHVKGAINIGIDNTTHTEIDNSEKTHELIEKFLNDDLKVHIDQSVQSTQAETLPVALYG